MKNTLYIAWIHEHPDPRSLKIKKRIKENIEFKRKSHKQIGAINNENAL